jgi:hypothetical protein
VKAFLESIFYLGAAIVLWAKIGVFATGLLILILGGIYLRRLYSRIILRSVSSCQ